MLVNRDNTINETHVAALMIVPYAKGTSPFNDLHPGVTKHHIIDCEHTLGPLWTKFTEYLSWVNDNRAAVNDDVINSLREFDNYIISTGGNFNNIAGLRNRVIWNPGNLALGPAPETRGPNDPARRTLFEPQVVVQALGDIFGNQFTRFMDYDFLCILQNSGGMAIPILNNFRNALREIQLLVTNNSTHAIPRSLTTTLEVARAWGRFWQHWLKIYRPGYLRFKWVRTPRYEQFPASFIGNSSELTTLRGDNRMHMERRMQGGHQLGASFLANLR